MPKTLLLADDSVTIQKVVGLSFANEEIELVTVDNGDDAVARANEIRPDIILADVVMPGLDGYEVCEAINGNEELAHIPVLLLSGTFEPFDEARANSAGAAGHITKPFEAQSLVDRVNNILASPPAPIAQEPAAIVPAAEEAPAPPACVDPGELTGAFDAALVSDDPLASPDLSFEDEIIPETPAALAEESLPFEEESSTFAIPDQGLSFGEDSGGADILGQPVADEEPIAKQHIADNMDQTIAFMPDGSTALESPAAVASLDDDSAWDLGESSLEVPPVAEATPSLENVPTFDDFAVSGHAVTDEETFVIGDDFGTTTPPSSVETAHQADLADPCEPAEPAFADDLSLDTETAEVTSFDMGEGAFEPADSTVDAAEMSFGGEIEPPWETANAAAPIEPEPEPIPASMDMSFEAPPAVEPPAPVEEPASAAPVSIEEAPLEPASPADEFQAPLAPSDAEPQNVITPEFQKHLHDTLEKLAWEAFSDVTEKLVKDALKQVEAIAWEVIPRMAETMVKEEIERMKGEAGEDE